MIEDSLQYLYWQKVILDKNASSVSALYLNPFTQDPEYRQYVLHHLPSLRFLDRKGWHP